MEQNATRDRMEETLKERLRELQISSQKDALTGLWNRNYLKSQIDEHLSVPANSGVLFMLDLDNFKQVNDCYGHIMGDACLVELSEILRGSVREEDIVSRLGGDEFVLFFRGGMSKEIAALRAERLIGCLNETFRKMEIDCPISVSIGVALAPEQGSDFQTLYRKADKALYDIKNQGKNNYCVYGEIGGRTAPKPEGGTKVDLALVKRFISEPKSPKGAYRVEYEGFKRIYQFLSRYTERNLHEIQVILFSLIGRDEERPDKDGLSGVLFDLERVIKGSLRVGDVATNYSSTQYLVILMDATTENAERVAKRVLERFASIAERYRLKLEYDIDKMRNSE